MAFTEQNKADAYLFFALAFNAAPGKQFGAQIVQAYEAGMTTADIVAQYVTKPEFLKLYPAAQTTKEFATALVTNVAAASTSVAAKNAAIADIEKAIAAGWTKDQVIVQILGNLATKPVTDLDWGTTKAQLDNKIAVAKVLTEGDKALDTTDAALLQGPLKGVTEDAATVAAALDKSSVLVTKLENLAASNKAKAAFAAALDLNADGKPDALTVANVDTTVAANVTGTGSKGAALDTVLGTTAVFNSTTSTAEQKAAALNKGKADVAKAVADAQLAVAATVAEATTVMAPATTALMTATDLAQYKALKSAVATGEKAVLSAYAAQASAATKATALGNTAGVAITDASAPTTTDQVTFGATTVAYNATTKTFAATDAQLAAITDAAQKQSFVDLLAAVNANLTAVAALKASADGMKSWGDVAYATGTTSLVPKAATTDGQVTVNLAYAAPKAAAAEAVVTAENSVTTQNAKYATLEKAVSAYDAAVKAQADLKTVNDAIAAAQKSFTDSKLPLPIDAKEGLIVATGADDTFLPVGEKFTISGFNLLGKDSIYVGSSYVLNSTGDLAKGDNAALEVFFKANGADTDVYLEQKAFGSGVNGAAAGTKDIFKITLTGVAADKLALKDGFVVAA